MLKMKSTIIRIDWHATDNAVANLEPLGCMTALRAVVIGGIGLTDNCVALESLVRNIKTSLYQPLFKQPVSIWNFF